MTITARNGLIFQTDLDAFWTPFAYDPASDQSRRVLSRASDMHYYPPDGRAILDGQNQRMRYGPDFTWVRHNDRGNPSSVGSRP